MDTWEEMLWMKTHFVEIVCNKFLLILCSHKNECFFYHENCINLDRFRYIIDFIDSQNL